MATIPQVQSTLFDTYFKYVEDTEAPLIFHRWSLITTLGALLGRQFWIPFGSGKITPTCYTMLVGNPGTRKSSAIKTAKRILAATGYDKFAAENTTKEKFLLDLEDAPEEEQWGSYNPKMGRARKKKETVSAEDLLEGMDLLDASESVGHDGIPKEILIAADEFNDFMGSGNIDFLSMLGVLWDWDDPAGTYKHRFKNSKSISIYQPTISILAGNTHAGLQTAFPAESIGQGFMSRLLLIYGESSGKKITFPKRPPEHLEKLLIDQLGKIRDAVAGEAKLSAGATQAIDTIYRSWQDLDDYRFKHYSTRRLPHLLKLCLICTATRLSTTIDIQDVVLANTILTFTERNMSKALGEFGKSRNSEASQTIMAALYEAKKPLLFEDLWKLVSRDLERREALADILHGLQQADKIQAIQHRGFLSKTKPINTNAVYIDFKLLKEYHGNR